MNNSIFHFKRPVNEPILSYAPGSPERAALQSAVDTLSEQQIEIPLVIGGREVRTGNLGKIVMPTDNTHVLAVYHKAGEAEVKQAIEAAAKAKRQWAEMDWVDRASIMLRVAELIAKKYRYLMNASTMLGQGKNPFQAEIDCVCELVDFLRFNVYYAGQIYSDQPDYEAGTINRCEYRPLEGFVFAVSPFNFTSIAGNLNISPVLMGNVTLWKPSSTSILSNYYLMRIFQEAGVPDGVINFLPGQGSIIGKAVFESEQFAGVHFTGSTATFAEFWRTMAQNIRRYRSYPRIVGETGGKDFIMVHNSAEARQTAVAIVRGAFEYQGQKCSAASRAYIPRSLWPSVKEQVGEMLETVKMGDVRDFSNYVNAVIDETSFDNISAYIDRARNATDAEIVFGGGHDKTVGYFIEPTVILAHNPHYETLTDELFGPVITIYVYDDEEYEKTLDLVDHTSNYALTGSILGYDRYAVDLAVKRLRDAAGNFYINDKPTGAVVGQQPFGGARGSGTNDKAGSYVNLLRWVSIRAIKENLNPPTEYGYPFMGK